MSMVTKLPEGLITGIREGIYTTVIRDAGVFPVVNLRHNTVNTQIRKQHQEGRKQTNTTSVGIACILL